MLTVVEELYYNSKLSMHTPLKHEEEFLVRNFCLNNLSIFSRCTSASSLFLVSGNTWGHLTEEQDTKAGLHTFRAFYPAFKNMGFFNLLFILISICICMCISNCLASQKIMSAEDREPKCSKQRFIPENLRCIYLMIPSMWNYWWQPGWE